MSGSRAEISNVFLNPFTAKSSQCLWKGASSCFESFRKWYSDMSRIILKLRANDIFSCLNGTHHFAKLYIRFPSPFIVQCRMRGWDFFPHLSKSATVASIYIWTLCSAITHLWQERFTSNFLMLLKLSPKADRSDDEQHWHKIIPLLLLFLSFMDLFPSSFAPWCRINMLKSKTISTVDDAEWRKKDFHVYLSSLLSPRFVLVHCSLTVLLSFS